MGRCRQRRRRGRVGRTVRPARRSPEKWCSSPGPRAASAERWRSPAPRPGPTWPSRTAPTAAAPTIRPRASARTVAPHIRVNVLGPGWIETAYGESLDPTVKERITRSIPLSRWGTPQDVAHAAVYLASDAAAYVTGQMLMINGGAVV